MHNYYKYQGKDPPYLQPGHSSEQSLVLVEDGWNNSLRGESLLDTERHVEDPMAAKCLYLKLPL